MIDYTFLLLLIWLTMWHVVGNVCERLTRIANALEKLEEKK
jgi:hypothetical protein